MGSIISKVEEPSTPESQGGSSSNNSPAVPNHVQTGPDIALTEPNKNQVEHSSEQSISSVAKEETPTVSVSLSTDCF